MNNCLLISKSNASSPCKRMLTILLSSNLAIYWGLNRFAILFYFYFIFGTMFTTFWGSILYRKEHPIKTWHISHCKYGTENTVEDPKSAKSPIFHTTFNFSWEWLPLLTSWHEMSRMNHCCCIEDLKLAWFFLKVGTMETSFTQARALNLYKSRNREVFSSVRKLGQDISGNMSIVT